MPILKLKFIIDPAIPSARVVEFHGQLDPSNIAETETRIADLLAVGGFETMIFDLKDLSYTNSNGIGFLVSVHARLVRFGKKLLICGVRSNVMEIFELIGLPKIVPVFSSLTDAFASIQH